MNDGVDYSMAKVVTIVRHPLAAILTLKAEDITLLKDPSIAHHLLNVDRNHLILYISFFD